jgi:hypothetical protein
VVWPRVQNNRTSAQKRYESLNTPDVYAVLASGAGSLVGRSGDFEALVAVLDPGVGARSHGRTGVFELRGADKVARVAMTVCKFAPFVRAAVINGAAGAVAFDGDTRSRSSRSRSSATERSRSTSSTTAN